jgi:hypothetical protein
MAFRDARQNDPRAVQDAVSDKVDEVVSPGHRIGGRVAEEVVARGSVNLMAKGGQLGGELFPTEKIPALVKYLERRGIWELTGVSTVSVAL